MRHSRFAQSYNYAFPSLEVTEAEMLARTFSKSRTSETIAQMSIPKADLPETMRSRMPAKPRPGIVRRSHSVADVHRVTIHRNVTRRIQAAQALGDETLLQALEAELSAMISA